MRIDIEYLLKMDLIKYMKNQGKKLNINYFNIVN